MPLPSPRRVASLVLSCGLVLAGATPALAAARVFSLPGRTLVATPADAPLAALRTAADAALALPPSSVLDKPLRAASGDPRDYLSMAPYWWPDPTKPEGLPYVRRDGAVNPASFTGTDKRAFLDRCAAVETLGLAWHFTRHAPYANHAALLVRTWFLDPATGMHPNFQHAQAIPGITAGRGIGLIESRELMRLNDGLALLAGSPAWSEADAAAMHAWLTAFYQWLRTSENGRDEADEANNHGSWYAAQAAHLALVLGRRDEARALLEEVRTTRLAAQIEPDGRQPLELARTKSLDYCFFNLEALFVVARLGEQVGVDLWSHVSSDGRSLRGALTYVAPYADPARPWLKADLEDADRSRLLPLLAEGLAHWDDATLRTTFTAEVGKPAHAAARWWLTTAATAITPPASSPAP